jgi:hypothetical protein
VPLSSVCGRRRFDGSRAGEEGGAVGATAGGIVELGEAESSRGEGVEVGGGDFGAVTLKTEMAEGESAAVIGPTRLPASRVASPFRCNLCEPESLVEPSTTPSSSLSIPVSRVTAEISEAHVVDEDDDDVGFVGCCRGTAKGEQEERQKAFHGAVETRVSSACCRSDAHVAIE